MANRSKLLLPFFIVLLVAAGEAEAAVAAAGRREVLTARNGAVATDDGRCSEVGLDALRDGGNAVDAAVAASLCLGVVSPASSGIGGGGFMLVRLADGTAAVYDSRETAPIGASQDMYHGNETVKAEGILSVAVPGELAGLYKAWKQHGKLPWRRLVRPAARLARAFKISPYLRMQMEKTESGILQDKGLRELFTSDRHLLKVGDICRNDKLAQTLDAIARHGPRVFYHGVIGTHFIRDVQKRRGILTKEDLRRYRVKVRKPLSKNITGLTVLTMPPPSAGGAGIILIWNILAQFGSVDHVSDALSIHRLIESLKHYVAIKMNLGDPDFVNVTNVLSDMLSTEFALKLKKTINDSRTFGPDYYGDKWNIIGDHGTSHLSIVDAERNAVSMTSTVNSYFGSTILSPSTGILLNNEMDDFSMPAKTVAGKLPPSPANFIRPFKRPLSSMAPTIVLKDGQLRVVGGASGGLYIPGGTIEVLLNYFVKKLDPFSSVMAPRVYHQLIPNVVQYENWTTVLGDHIELGAQTRAELQKKGHVLQPLAGGSISQFVVHNIDSTIAEAHHKGIRKGDLTAVSDPRKGGVPAGY